MGWWTNLFSSTAIVSEEESPRRSPGAADDFWYDQVGTKSASGLKVTPAIAMKASAVYACVKILAETIASLSLEMSQRTVDGWEEAPNHPIAEVLGYQPNGWQTAVEFWEFMVLHAAIEGEAFAEIVPGARGAVDQLIPLHPLRVKQVRLPGYRIGFDVTDENGKTRRLTQDEVFRLPGLSSDGLNGIRAIDMAADAIGLGLAADTYASKLFANGINFGFALVSQKKMGEEAQKNLIQALMRRFAGAANAHRPIILQDGIKPEKMMGQTASEAQLLEARKWQIAEVARYWRIPLHMLNIDDSTNRSTVEEQSLNFVKYTLRPWCKRIEQAIRRDLIIAKSVYRAKFNLEDLQRGNAKDSAEYFAKALGSGGTRGWLTQNEVRKILGLNAKSGGDDLPMPTSPAGQPAGGGVGSQLALPPPQSLEERCSSVIHKEVVVMRKAIMNHAPDAWSFAAYVKAFYGGHVSTVAQRLEIPKDAAKAYCGFRADTLIAANDPAGAVDALEATGAAELAGILAAHGEVA